MNKYIKLKTVCAYILDETTYIDDQLLPRRKNKNLAGEEISEEYYIQKVKSNFQKDITVDLIKSFLKVCKTLDPSKIEDNLFQYTYREHITTGSSTHFVWREAF